MGRSAIDPQHNKSRLPHQRPRQCVGSLLPNVRIPILGCSYDAIRIRGPINGGDDFVML